MLLLCVFLLSSCLSGSMGSAIEEFQENFKPLVALASNEIFLPVPAGKFQCSHVPCHLEKTIEWLKENVKNDEMRTCVSLMEKNMDHIISTLNKAHTEPKKDRSCRPAKKPLQSALKRYRRFFQRVHEECWKP